MNAIDVVHLSRDFGAFKAVDDVSFHVERGEIFGYLGANGAGKSTTIRMLCGLLRPTRGQATVAGHDIDSDAEGVKRAIGYMSQRFSLYTDLTVEENLAFFGGAYGLSGRPFRDRRDTLIGKVGLQPFLRVSTASLPGGVRQRLALVCSMLHAPEIIFLDEPTAGVDPEVRRDFWSLIRGLARDGTTIFVTTHYMDEAEYCRRIGLMVDGQLRALDTPAGLKSRWVPGDVRKLSGPDLLGVAGAVRRAPGVLALEPFGADWHLRTVNGALDDAGLHALLAEHGIHGVSVAPAEATLEDVFLAVVAPPEVPS